jgi:Flp pilus assembly protein TadG
MMKLQERLVEHFRSRFETERGAVLVLSAMVLVVLMGMAAIAVDYGWLAYNRLEVRKAAEAAALAGVVHMPLPGSVTFGAGAEPYDVAVDAARRNGYVDGVGGVTVTPQETWSTAQLKVTVTDQVDTFFLKMFIASPLTVSGDAIGEHLPVLKLGSDENVIGGSSSDFWVAVNGERRKKQDGDPFSTRCLQDNCIGPGDNDQFRDPAYYFAVEVDPTVAGGSLGVYVFDGTHKPRGVNDSTGDLAGGEDLRLRWRLYAPDATPNNWIDNTQSPHVCQRTFRMDGEQSQGAGWGVDEWRGLGGCGNSTAGIYVLQLEVFGDDNALSAFALGATVNGSDNGVSVYGLGDLSLWMNGDDTTPTFKIVRLDTVYAGTELVLELFDPGDIDGSGKIEFTGAMSGIDCQVQIERYDADGVYQGTTGWMTDGAANSGAGGDWAGSSCGLTSSGNGGSNKIYNNDWVRFRFQIPATHSCSGDACWVYTEYAVDNPTERTTWSAKINGTPIHLMP